MSPKTEYETVLSVFGLDDFLGERAAERLYLRDRWERGITPLGIKVLLAHYQRMRRD